MTPTTTEPAAEEAVAGSVSSAAATAAPADSAPSRLRSRLRGLLRGTRTRMLLAYVVILALSLLIGIVVIRQVLVDQVQDRVESDLRTQALELGRLADGNDPRTGRPFGTDVRAVFDAFLAGQVVDPDVGLYTLVDGVPYLTNSAPPAELTMDGRFVASLAALQEPRRGRLLTSAGPAEYLAVPVRVPAPGEQRATAGVLVAAEFTAEQLDQLDTTMWKVALGLLSVLAVASAASYAAAGRVLAPLREAVETARSIQERNLSRRIPVSGVDEIAELGRTFNAMLDRLETAVRAQRDFVSDAGHELRTPITIVRGHLELMTDDPQDRRETVALVTDELDRMSRLVDDLLLLATTEQADFLVRRRVAVVELMSSIFAKVQALAPRDWRLGPVDDVVVEADPQRLTQAVMQLAQNATQHTADTAGITLSATATTDGEVRLEVLDEGAGIPAGDRGRIFERFARLPGERRRSDGYGLGLSLVRAIAEAHGGRVEVDSQPGRGSAFAVVLPGAVRR